MAIGEPSVWPSKTPERISARSGSSRGVVIALWPGRRRSRSRWISSTRQRQARRAAVDDDADAAAVRLAEGGDPKQMAERRAHGRSVRKRGRRDNRRTTDGETTDDSPGRTRDTGLVSIRLLSVVPYERLRTPALPRPMSAATRGGCSGSRSPSRTTRSARLPGVECAALVLLPAGVGGAGGVGAQPVFVGAAACSGPSTAPEPVRRVAPCVDVRSGACIAHGSSDEAARRTPAARHGAERHPDLVVEDQPFDQRAHVIDEARLHDADGAERRHLA